MAITDWPEAERPREKLLSRGAGALSDAELLAIFLRTGVKGRTAIDIGRELIGRYDGLRGLVNADSRQLVQEEGLGPAKIALLQAALELGHRCLQQELVREGAIADVASCQRYLLQKMRDYRREVFSVLFLDVRHQVIKLEDLFFGTLDCASVHPREVIRRALELNAAAVIFAHNHPSGVAEPSRADVDITRRLKEGLALVDIQVLDHFVVGDQDCISLASRGLM